MWLPSVREYLCRLSQKQQQIHSPPPTNHETKQNQQKKKSSEEERQHNPSPVSQHVQCPPNPGALGLGGTLESCGSHHSDLTDLPGEVAVVLILTSTPQSRNYTERSFGAVSVSVVRLLKVCKDSDLTVLQEPSGGWPQQAPQVYPCSMAQAGDSEERRQPGPSAGRSQGSGTLLAPCLGSWWQLPRHSERV